MTHPLPVIFLMGPTAVGKTAVAVELVKRLPLEIISVDSALIYRGMDIGTAKPDHETLARAPHRLIDICEPNETYSAACFRHDALMHIEDIHKQQRIPLLVGGGMLYFKALEEGLSWLPEADPEVRARLEKDAEQIGWAQMHARLRTIDPVAAERIHPNDPQRIQRALEVYEITGSSMSTLQDKKNAIPLNYPLHKLVLNIENRELLHQRIEQRFDAMLAQGFAEEVRFMREQEGMHASLPSVRAVGYRQMWEHLNGEYDEIEMRRRGIVATRRYAKRQMTWLRSQKNVSTFDALDNTLINELVKKIGMLLK
ncbi:MAG: tRNA (adenosine(37)-N6)-dimethylallyltransferase MiaA [Gammaproteobacteria bacterium]|nr:tRNA (adenosine(37)-N6)-dimethylallyltransferase MiaA [Gammaproteobacteria bacterium]